MCSKQGLQGLTLLVATLLLTSHTRAAWAQSQGWAPVLEQPDSTQRVGSTPAAPANTWKPAGSGRQQHKPVWTGPVRDQPSFNKSNRVVWKLVSPDEPELVPMDPAIAKAQIPLPPVPALQSLNRSLAFGDGSPGPDLAWKVPQGFRWSEEWFLDVSVAGANTRPPNSQFFAWNNGDAVGDIHVRVFQQERWTFGLNASLRSVYQGSNAAGGTTAIGDGFATGFRFDYALSQSSGIAIGAEQLIQYDSNNDSGRNLYLVGSKGWWLGGRGGKFPLLVGTAGVGTGRLGDNKNLQFGCINQVNASIDVSKSYPLCWSPIASASILLNQYWSILSEYNSQDVLAGISVSGNDGFPIRLTWGVLLGNAGTNYNYVGDSGLRWFFRGSIGL